jgi:hypothetical protein
VNPGNIRCETLTSQTAGSFFSPIFYFHFPFEQFSVGRMPVEDSLARSFGIDALVQIDPQYAGEECNRRRERQEKDGGPENDFRKPPTGQQPQQDGDRGHDQNSQDVTEVHGAQKVAWFALKLEVTDAAALAHLRESAKDGIAKDSAHAATGAALAKDASEC